MSITCELLLQLNGACVLRLFDLQPIKLQWVINMCLLYVISKIHLLRFIYCHDCFIYNKYVILVCFIYPSSQHSTYHTNFESTALLYLVTQLFTAYKYIDELLKCFITNKTETLKEGGLSGVGQQLWGRSWLWFKLSGFSDS